MLKPRNTSLTPPKGWSVTIEGAGPEIRSHNWTDFLKQVRVRLESNDLDKHGWKEEVIDLMCRQRPDIESDDDGAVPSRAVTGDDLRRFVATLWEAWKEGAVAVSAEEQDRRAAICLACPNKGHISCFGGCGTLAQAISDMVVSSKGKSYPELNRMGCLACGCELESLIRYPLNVLQAVDAKIGFLAKPYHESCWKLEKQEGTAHE